MYYDKFFPFYVAYANPALYDGERIQEKEFQMMKSYYPQTVQQIQKRVEEELSLIHIWKRLLRSVCQTYLDSV